MHSFWEIYVKDPKASRDFYRSVVGLELVREQSDFIVLQKGQAKLHICPIEDLPEPLDTPGAQRERLGARVEFCFEVDDVRSIYKQAAASGFDIIEPLQDQPWGKTDFRVLDPDGAYVRVTSARDRPNLCEEPGSRVTEAAT